METIRSLEIKLDLARLRWKMTDEEDVKYPTGIIIDLGGPEGNVFYIMGLCNKLFREMKIESEWPKFYKECQKSYYKDVLTLARRWFGFIYLNENKQ